MEDYKGGKTSKQRMKYFKKESPLKKAYPKSSKLAGDLEMERKVMRHKMREKCD